MRKACQGLIFLYFPSIAKVNVTLQSTVAGMLRILGLLFCCAGTIVYLFEISRGLSIAMSAEIFSALSVCMASAP